MSDALNAGLTAADIMTPSPRTCSLYSTVMEAVMIFRDQDCGAVPVIDKGKPVGVLTDRDVALAITEFEPLSSRTVDEIMNRGVVAVKPEDTVQTIYESCLQNSVRRILVIDASEQLCGIIAWADLLPHLTTRAAGELTTRLVEPA